MATFGSRLRRLREAKGWSQEKLGFELDLTKAAISKWENARAEPGLKQLTALRDIFLEEIGSLDNLICDGLWERNYVTAWKNVSEGRIRYEPAEDPRCARDESELGLLLRFRRYAPRKRRAILELLSTAEDERQS